MLEQGVAGVTGFVLEAAVQSQPAVLSCPGSIDRNRLRGSSHVACFSCLCLGCSCLSVRLQQPYLFAWVNHIRTGLYGMAANTALLLAINLYADAELQASSKHVSLQHILEARAARSEQLTLYALVLLPAALVAGMLLSWLRLRLWVHPVLNRFRCVVFGDMGLRRSYDSHSRLTGRTHRVIRSATRLHVQLTESTFCRHFLAHAAAAAATNLPAGPTTCCLMSR